jgi:hypothetical protein
MEYRSVGVMGMRGDAPVQGDGNLNKTEELKIRWQN